MRPGNPRDFAVLEEKENVGMAPKHLVVSQYAWDRESPIYEPVKSDIHEEGIRYRGQEIELIECHGPVKRRTEI